MAREKTHWTSRRTLYRDERMRIQSYFEGHEFLYRLTKQLATNPKPIP